jgi:4-amino-4-deoxy-L-arabinose transferase-like glycosyltransferase
MWSRLRSFGGGIALAAVAGLALRLFYVFGPGRHVTEFGDYHYFHSAANLIAEGHWFVDPNWHLISAKYVPSATHPPLWTLLLGGASWFGGTDELAHRAVGCFVGAVAIVLIGLLGRRVGGPLVGLVAASLAAVYPVLIGADGSLMSEPLFGVFVLSALLLAFRLRDRPSLWMAVALGVAVGLSALTRSEGLALLFLLALPAAVWRAPPGGWKRFVACLVACLVVLTPWLVRNWSAFDRPVLISTNDGSLLAGANCDLTYHGISKGIWTTDCLSPEAPRSERNEAEQAAVWRDKGTSYAWDHLGRLPVVMAARLLRTFDFYQPWRMTAFAEGRWLKADKAGVISYFMLLPFSLFGAWLLLRGGRRVELLVLLTPAALVVLQTVGGYGFPRFRHAADLVMVVLGAVAVCALGNRFTGLQVLRKHKLAVGGKHGDEAAGNSTRVDARGSDRWGGQLQHEDQ